MSSTDNMPQEGDAEAVYVLGLVGNVGNFIYNVPQVWRTIRTRSTRDFSALFLGLRFLVSIVFLAYGILVQDWWYTASSVVTLAATVVVGVFKAIEVWLDWRHRRAPFSFQRSAAKKEQGASENSSSAIPPGPVSGPVSVDVISPPPTLPRSFSTASHLESTA
jgi:uncharacterized protein with PQ loop repeat